MLYFFAALLAFVVGTSFCMAGVDYITIGYGLTPYLSFPIALIFFAMSMHQVLVGVQEYKIQREYERDLSEALRLVELLKE